MLRGSVSVKNECSFYDGCMPKVSDEHLAARRSQILDAAAACFAVQGFHRTSMADILAAADLSAGAVYRYFPSKEEIVAAIATQAGEGLRGVVDELRAREQPPSPQGALLELVRFVDGQAGPRGSLRIALQVWAEALRDERLHARVRETYGILRDGLADICRRAQAHGSLDPSVDTQALGRVLFSLVPGYVLRRLLMDDHLTPEDFVADLAAVVHLPLEVS